MSRSLVRSSLSVGLATAVASAFNYGTNMALGRWLGARAFADAALIVSSMLLLSALATGIQLSVARAVATGCDEGIRWSRQTSLTGGAAAGAVLVLGAPVWAHLFHTGSITPFVLLGCGMPWYLSLSVRRGVLQASGDFDRLAATMVVEALGRTAITVGLLAAGAGASAAAAGLLGSFMLAWRTAGGPSGSRTVARATAGTVTRLHSSQSPMMLLLMAQVLIANGDVLVVSALLPEQAGVFAAVAMIGRMVYVAAWAVVTVAFPRLAETGTVAAQEAVFRRALMAILAIGATMTVAAAVAARPLLSGLLGADYASGASLLWPYALATTLFALANLVAITDVAAGKRRGPAWMLAGGAAQTMSLVILAPRGVQWAVWMQVVVMAALLVAVSMTRVVATARRRATVVAPGLGLLTR